MARGPLAAGAAAVVLLAGCGGGGGGGDQPDSISTAGMAARISEALEEEEEEEEEGVAAEVDCPDTVPVQDDGRVVFSRHATAPDGSTVQVLVGSLSRPDHLDFSYDLAPVGEIGRTLASELPDLGPIDCPDLVEHDEGAVVTCEASGDGTAIEVTLGSHDDDYTYRVVAESG